MVDLMQYCNCAKFHWTNFNPFQARLFYLLKVQRVFRDPPFDLSNYKACKTKLCTVIVLLKDYKIPTRIPKKFLNIIYYSKSNDESFPKMYFLLNLSD